MDYDRRLRKVYNQIVAPARHTRLTRSEVRGRTRTRLLAAAEESFRAKGFHGARVDEISEAAGHTKGAVYSQFGSKEGLFLALLDRHVDEQLLGAEGIAEVDTEIARRQLLEGQTASAAFVDREWGLLATEFLVYAARRPELRSELATRYTRIRQRVAELIQEASSKGADDAKTDQDGLAAAIVALAEGFMLQRFVDPEAATGESYATTVLALLKDLRDP